MSDNKIKNQIDSIIKRVEKLEKAVFDKPRVSPSTNEYTGLVGGITFLIDNGFF